MPAAQERLPVLRETTRGVVPEAAGQLSGISQHHRVIRLEIPDNACGVSGMTFTYFGFV
tara:strand:+ start:257 stop:433 length:177 start_codon:yes stop_codon:yes gene_type:complete